MSQELMKVSDLHAPTVSGTVKISLAEMDRLRANYLAAVKLAQELEGKQSLIKVIYSEEVSGTTAVEDMLWNPNGESRPAVRYESYKNYIDRIEYRNMNEIKGRFKFEAEQAVEKDVKMLRDSKSDAFKRMIAAEEVLDDYKKKFKKNVLDTKQNFVDAEVALAKKYKHDHKEMLDLRRENRTLTESVSISALRIENIVRRAARLQDELNDNSLKGIWNRIFY